MDGILNTLQKKTQMVLYKIYGPCLVRYQGQIDTFQLYGFNTEGNVRFLDKDKVIALLPTLINT